jgi:hypothetical protein
MIPEVTTSYLGIKRRAVLIGFAAWMPARSDASTPTEWEIRPTDAVVPVDLLHGPHYTFGETVTTLAYLKPFFEDRRPEQWFAAGRVWWIKGFWDSG